MSEILFYSSNLVFFLNILIHNWYTVKFKTVSSSLSFQEICPFPPVVSLHIRLKFHVKRHQNQVLLCVAFLCLMECFWGSRILNSSFFYRRVVFCRTSIPELVRPSADAHVGCFQFGALFKNKIAINILCMSLFEDRCFDSLWVKTLRSGHMGVNICLILQKLPPRYKVLKHINTIPGNGAFAP